MNYTIKILLYSLLFLVLTVLKTGAFSAQLERSKRLGHVYCFGYMIYSRFLQTNVSKYINIEIKSMIPKACIPFAYPIIGVKAVLPTNRINLS